MVWVTESRAKAAGREAYRASLELDDNPFSGRPARAQWIAGYKAEKAGVPASPRNVSVSAMLSKIDKQIPNLNKA